MWIFLKDSFLSVVAHRDHPDDLLVRARKKGDIQRVFPEVAEQHTPCADYPYRATIPRARVAEVLSEQARAIAYDNFKNRVEDDARHDAYLECWAVMARWGRRQS